MIEQLRGGEGGKDEVRRNLINQQRQKHYITKREREREASL